jgi:hypothetical protein
MSLAGVEITFSDGALGIVNPPADGVSAMAIKFGGTTSETGWKLFRTYDQVKQESGYPTDDSDTGMLEVKAYFDKGGEKLYLKRLAANATYAAISIAEMDALYEASKGEVRTLGIVIPAATETDITSEIVTAMQANANRMRETYYSPLQVIIASTGIPTAAITPSNDCPDVSVVVGQTNPNVTTYISSIGALMGRLAASDVQVHPGRVSDGALVDAAYDVYSNTLLTNLKAEDYNGNSFITYRTFAGKGGYYVSDDPTMSDPKSDYHSFARRRTINKAYRVAYNVLVNRVNSEIETSGGMILPVVAKALEGEVESAIRSEMTRYGNLVDVNGDGGVQCKVDETWDVMATSTLMMTLKVRPYGYAKWIKVDLGFML